MAIAVADSFESLVLEDALESWELFLLSWMGRDVWSERVLEAEHMER